MSKTPHNKRLIRTIIFCAIAALIGISIAVYNRPDADVTVINKGMSGSPSSGVSGIAIGGPFELLNQDGETITQDSYPNKLKLIYFGFTYCPAICPTELQKISQVMKQLGDQADQIQPLFITVDPERDTTDILKDYISLYDERLVGLTGSHEAIDQVLKAYRIFARKVEQPELSDYTMDHSSFIYLMSKDNQLLGIYRIKDDATYITEDVKKHL